MKYNKINRLGILDGDRVRFNRGDCLMEVKLTENKWTAFWEFISVRLRACDRLIEGSLKCL